MHRLSERFAICLCTALASASLWQLLALGTFNLQVALLLVPLPLIALGVADLLSGVMHFLLDCKGASDTPFWGIFIQPFREHHDDPSEMTRHDFIHTNGHTAMAIVPLQLAVMLSFRQPMDVADTLQFLLLTSLLIFLGLTNQFHKWAHAKDAPRIIRWLQAKRLVLPPAHHARHHVAHRDHFCITTGWNNRWLARTRLLERLFAVDHGSNVAESR